MLEWKGFGREYELLGVGERSVVFGVDNFQENRKSALKLSLCDNKVETLREIGLMNIC